MSRLEHFDLQERVRMGLNLCKTNSALNCGRCPYYSEKDEDNKIIDDCTSELAADAEELINKLIGNKIYVYGAYYKEENNNG